MLKPTTTSRMRILISAALFLTLIAPALWAQTTIYPTFPDLPKTMLVPLGQATNYTMQPHDAGYAPSGISIAQPWYGVAANSAGWLAYEGYPSRVFSGIPNTVGSYRLTVWAKNFYCAYCTASLDINVYDPAVPANRINPSSFDFYSEGGADHVDVYAFVNWTATTTDPWISVTSTSIVTNGSTAGRVDYTVAANMSASARTGHITIGGRTFTVNQYAAATVTISPVTRDFTSDGGSGTIAVTANTTWSATTANSWIHILPPTSGSGNATVSYTVDANSALANRSGSITIGGNTFAVQQLGTTPSLVVSPLAFDFAQAGGNGAIAVTANTSWTASTSAFWVNLSSGGTSGSGNGTIYFNVSPNPGTSSRSTVITVGGTSVVINQLGISPTVVISPASSTFSAQSGSGTISITANTAWTASTSQSWIHLFAPASGSGNATLYFTVDPNSGTTNRSGTITISGTTHQVSQSGTTPPPPLSISPTLRNFSSLGGSAAIGVTASVSWSATTTASWIHLTSGTSGNGYGTVYYTVDENTNTTSRSDAIAVSGLVHTIYQAGPGTPGGANIQWVGASGASWNNPSSWSPPRVPGPNDEVTLTNIAVTMPSGAEYRLLNLRNFLTLGWPIVINTGQTIRTVGIIPEGYCIQGGQGCTLTINSGGVLIVSSNSTLQLTGWITNYGSVTVEGNLQIQYGAPDVPGYIYPSWSGIINYSGGLVELRNKGYLRQSDTNKRRVPFDNYGTVRRVGNSGSSEMSCFFSNYGITEVMNGTLWFSGVGWKSSTPGFLVRDVYPKNPMNNYGEMRFGISSTNVFGTIRISYVFPSECASVGCPEPTWLVGSISPILLNGFLPASGQAFLVGDVGPLSTGSSTVPIIPAPTTSLFDGNFVSIYAVVGPYKEDLFLSFARSSIPVFTTQPTNRVVSPSETTRFVVLATGAPTNMAYRWFKDGLPLLGVARITGTTSNVLTIANIQTADLGDYYVTASNLVGVTTSQVAQMWMPPTISVQPLSQVLAEGANTGLGVSVAGTQPMSYQWLLNGTNLPDSGNVGGTMGPTLTLLNLQPANAGSYSVVITNLVGSTTSSVATVSLSPSAPTISIQPQSQTVAVHGDVQLNCFAAGTMPISYQWRRNETNLVDGAKVIGGAAAILSLYDLGGADSGNYTLVASNAYGSATSMVAVVSVVLPPSIVQQPQSQGIKIGGTFSALVQATGGTPLTYQWRRNSTNLINGGRIAGVATTNLSITGLVPGDAGNYDVVVTNASGLTNSAVAVLSVLIPPSITAQPQNVATNVGAAATFSVGTSGSAPMNFQWQFNGTNLVNSAFASGVNSNVLTLSNIQANAVGFYSVVVSNSVGVTNSQIATLSLFLNQTFTFANSNQIVINDNAKATPYPTTLTVSGVSAAVQRARVTLVNVTHSYPADIQALLVGPLGQKVLLMSGAGVSMSPNQTFIFSDTATGMLPQSSQLLSGTYLPTAWPPTPTFPSPAPAAPFGSALSVFTNQNPNGVWTLYVMDNSAGDAGVIAGGWSVALDTSATQMQAPSITSTPRGLARTAGESAAFSVTAAGTQPFYYLWRRNGTNLTDGVRISGTGTPLLTLTNLQRSDAASFTVVVSNLVSAVTSTPPAVLTVAPIMFDSSARQLDGTFQLNLHGEIGTVFVIQNSADLKTWKQLVTFTNTTGVFQFTDPGAASTEKRFYRAIAQ